MLNFYSTGYRCNHNNHQMDRNCFVQHHFFPYEWSFLPSLLPPTLPSFFPFPSSRLCSLSLSLFGIRMQFTPEEKPSTPSVGGRLWRADQPFPTSRWCLQGATHTGTSQVSDGCVRGPGGKGSCPTLSTACAWDALCLLSLLPNTR